MKEAQKALGLMAYSPAPIGSDAIVRSRNQEVESRTVKFTHICMTTQ